jgi:hypothetical protein
LGFKLMTSVRVLNLGAGVQTAYLYLSMLAGERESVDAAVFADTEDEPEWVYDHLEWLKTLGGPPIVVTSAGSLSENLIHGVNSTGGRFASIPACLSNDDDGTDDGVGRRQCTREYKIAPIEAAIRKMLGVGFGKRIPSDTMITQVIGLSFDEPKRVAKTRARYFKRKNWQCELPLFDEFLTRSDCISWLKSRYPHIEFLRSACVHCPFRTDAEWVILRERPKWICQGGCC